MKLPPANITHFFSLDPGQVWVAPEYRDIFSRHSLTTFASFMAYDDGQRYKRNTYREVLRFELPGTPPLFLKKHFRFSLRDAITTRLGLTRAAMPAYNEAQSIGYLEALGISTMKIVAFGQEKRPFGCPRSFLITEEIPAGIKLEQYLLDEQQKWREDPQFRRSLIGEIAKIARSMHTHNIHHQDFYLGHILISWETDSRFRLWVIDLQRMHKRLYLADRWWIKDLAQIHYAAPYPLVSNTDRLRFWLRYQERCSLLGCDRKWLARIERRKRKIDRHERNKETKKQRNKETKKSGGLQ